MFKEKPFSPVMSFKASKIITQDYHCLPFQIQSQIIVYFRVTRDYTDNTRDIFLISYQSSYFYNVSDTIPVSINVIVKFGQPYSFYLIHLLVEILVSFQITGLLNPL